MSQEHLSIDITTERQGEALIYKLRGSLDIATSPSLRAALTQSASEGKDEIVVDLTKLEFLDSTGLGALIGAHRRALESGSQVRLAVGDGAIARLLNITGLVRVFPTYPTLEDALADRARVTVAAG